MSGITPFFLFRAASLLLCTLLLVVGAPSAGSSAVADHAYMDELLHNAKRTNLSEQRFWHILLHYKKRTIGGYISEADDPQFFLAPNGKTDPQAELEATIEQFFMNELVGRSQQPAQCAFTARYHWLKERLSFDDDRLPPQRCERFEAWYAELNPQGVSLIFPSAFMNNPASMFGHTLLRIDQKGQTEQTRILAYTINYAADVPPGEGLLFPLRGIGGGYQGYFSTVPYYLKVKEYRDIENRDIWEYRLNFTQEQTRWLLLHAWEMGNAYFDYYFFKENCSYHLLSLLEVADPSLRLRDRFHLWTVPADTIRLLNEHPGLIGEVTYRPSRSTLLKRKRAELSEGERRWLKRIVEDVSLAQSEAFKELPVERQAMVLDLASDYLRYRVATDGDQASGDRTANQKILLARSKLKASQGVFHVKPSPSPPEKGHRTSRASIGVGWRNDELITEASLRAAYHDLLDPDPGYTPDSQLELLSATVRYYADRERVRLERFTFADVLSLSPMDELFKSPSWKFSAGLETVRDHSCGLCSNWNINGGIGAAVESAWVWREVFFAFAEIDANYSSKAYHDNHRVGGGATVGLVATLTERWKVLGSGTYLGYPLGDQSDDLRGFFGMRYTLQQNWALRFEFAHRDHDNQGVFSVQAFF